MTEAKAHKFLSYWTPRLTWARELPAREAISRMMWNCIYLMILMTGLMLLTNFDPFKKPTYQKICVTVICFLINGSFSWILYRLWQARKVFEKHKSLDQPIDGSSRLSGSK